MLLIVILLHGHNGPPVDKYGKTLDRYRMAQDDPNREKLKGIITDNVRSSCLFHVPVLTSPRSCMNDL